MRSDHKGKGRKEVGVELKYCEHCGGLWVRECGGGVYCKHCRTTVAELPAPKKRAGRLILPVQPRTVVEDFEYEIEVEELNDFQEAGGVA
jgi:ferredoxin